MNINIIVAVDDCNGIGLNNGIPWYSREDLKNFAKLTKGNNNNAIIMGRNTWESLPKKPLPKRDNLILSSKENYDGENIKTFLNTNDVLRYCKDKNYDEVWIIGGSYVYNEFINMNINKLYISRINGDYNCDTFFPEIPNNYKIISNSNIDNNISLEVYLNTEV